MPKPSFGCLACRQRRIKCDERPGTCVQCERYGTPCPGYQDRFDVLLRPQNARASGSRHTKQAPRPGANSQRSNVEPANGVNRQQPESTEATGSSAILSRPVKPDPDNVALAMYYSSNCVDTSQFYCLDHVQKQGNGCLFAAIRVLGTAAKSQTWYLSDGPQTLTRGYNDAIGLLNSALVSPTESVMDSTLFATLIMSAIEANTNPNLSLDYWEAHNNGAAALLLLRGAEQVTTRLGALLFFQVYMQVTLSCILRSRHIPQNLYDLRESVKTHLVDTDHPLWRCQGKMMRFTDFMATMAHTDEANLDYETCTSIITEALCIYGESKANCEGADWMWQYHSRPSDRFGDIMGYKHVYHTVLGCQLWAGHRIATLLLLTVVTRVIKSYGARYPDLALKMSADNATSLIHQAALDTIACVPEFLAPMPSKTNGEMLHPLRDHHGMHSHEHAHPSPIFELKGENSQNLPFMHESLLPWSLYFAAKCEFVEPQTRHCILNILDSAGKTMRLQQWKVLANGLNAVR